MPKNLHLSSIEQERLSIVNSLLRGDKTNSQAAIMLGISIRQLKRVKKKIKIHGADAVVHQLKGRPGNHHLDLIVKQKALRLIKEKYSDFKPTFAAEKLNEEENITVNPQTLRKWLIAANLWKVRNQRKSDYHSFRARMPYYGELQQFDGSYHLWFEERLLNTDGSPKEVCLLASIDDATGKITKATFAANEGVMAVFTFWKEYIEINGKPLKIYLDKFSTYKINHTSSVDNTELLTQFQKAMKLLSIEVIPANSPQAKGRVERLFGTLQDRLVKELRLAHINTSEEGNRFLKEVFLPKFNARFSVHARKDGDVHRTLTKDEEQSMPSIFSVKYARRVNNDFTLQFKNNFYQLEELQPTTIRPKDSVMLEERLDGLLYIHFKEKDLNFFLLPSKPLKISSQPAILTNHPLSWKPSVNHPWRQYKQKP